MIILASQSPRRQELMNQAAELVAELRYLGVTQEELMALVKEEGK